MPSPLLEIKQSLGHSGAMEQEQQELPEVFLKPCGWVNWYPAFTAGSCIWSFVLKTNSFTWEPFFTNHFLCSFACILSGFYPIGTVTMQRGQNGDLTWRSLATMVTLKYFLLGLRASAETSTCGLAGIMLVFQCHWWWKSAKRCCELCGALAYLFFVSELSYKIPASPSYSLPQVVISMAVL